MAMKLLQAYGVTVLMNVWRYKMKTTHTVFLLIGLKAVAQGSVAKSERTDAGGVAMMHRWFNRPNTLKMPFERSSSPIGKRL